MRWMIALFGAHFGAYHCGEHAGGLSGVFAHTCACSGQDFNATAATLVFFSLGMFSRWGALQNILARGFYATRNTLTPAIVGTVLAFANLPVVLDPGTARPAHLGPAFASSLGITVYTVVLFILLNRRTGTTSKPEPLTLFFLKVCCRLGRGCLCLPSSTDVPGTTLCVARHNRSFHPAHDCFDLHGTIVLLLIAAKFAGDPRI